MNKNLLYSTDIIEHDPAIYNAITALDDKYPNAIAIFGGALRAYDYINCDEPSFEKFVAYLPTVAKNAKFYRWHEGTVGALRRFCHLCLVDPMLVELYLGMSLNELCQIK